MLWSAPVITLGLHISMAMAKLSQHMFPAQNFISKWDFYFCYCLLSRYLQLTRCTLTVTHLSLQIPTNESGLIEYRQHPFWLQKYCPSHEVDRTPRCCSCERMEVGQKYFISNGISLELLVNLCPSIHQNDISNSNVFVHGVLLSWFYHCHLVMAPLSPGES